MTVPEPLPCSNPQAAGWPRLWKPQKIGRLRRSAVCHELSSSSGHCRWGSWSSWNRRKRPKRCCSEVPAQKEWFASWSILQQQYQFGKSSNSGREGGRRFFLEGCRTHEDQLLQPPRELKSHCGAEASAKRSRRTVAERRSSPRRSTCPRRSRSTLDFPHSFPLPQYLCALFFHVSPNRSRTNVLKFPSLFSSGYALFQVPYLLSPLFAALTKTAGVCTNNSHSGTRRRQAAGLIPYPLHLIPFLFIPLRTLLHFFALAQNSTLLFSSGSALFAKKPEWGCYEPNISAARLFRLQSPGCKWHAANPNALWVQERTGGSEVRE